MPMYLTSPAFAEANPIPARFTCDEENVSPALDWSGQPEGTQSFALIAHDPDSPKGDFTHWVLFNIPPTTTGLREGVQPGQIGVSGVNDSCRAGYGGPCPPEGHRAHRYFFRLYALDVRSLPLGEAATRADLEAAMRGRTLAEAYSMGQYERPAGAESRQKAA